MILMEVRVDMDKICVGDTVEVINNGVTYPTYKNFFKENGIEAMGRNYKIGEDEVTRDGNIVKVLFVGKHKNHSDKRIAVVKLPLNTEVTTVGLINVSGLKKVEEYHTDRFKEGDILIGTRSTTYSIINQENLVEVVAVLADNLIEVKLYNPQKNLEKGTFKVKPCFFKLFSSGKKRNRITFNQDVRIVIQNKAVVLIDKQGNKGIARCNPADDFELKEGLVLAFTRMLDKELKKELKQ